jgi:membrane dipeptidase
MSASTPPLVIDGLNGAAVTREQFQRTLEGGVTAINLTCLSVFTKSPQEDVSEALLRITRSREIIRENADIALIADTVADIERAHTDGKLCVMLGAQNSTILDLDMKYLSTFRELGLRILQPTYNEQNAFGHGASFLGNEDHGITEAGRHWLEEMHRLHMLVDLSHCGHRTNADYIAAAKGPVVISHANAYALCPSPRNKPDEVIRAVAKTGGLIGAVMWPPTLKFASRPTIEDYIDQVEYLVKLAGIDHVGFASDLSEGFEPYPGLWKTTYGQQGMYPNICGVMGDWWRWDCRFTEGFESLSHTPRVWDAMRSRKFSESDIEKIGGGNWIRVLREVWAD